MTQLLPNFRVKSGIPVGNELYFQLPDLQDYPKTFLDSDASTGDSTLSANGLDFSINQFIIIGSMGSQKTEIIEIHSSTAPTATTITLASALSFNHNRGDIVRFIPFNQIEYQTSPDNITFTPQTVVAIQADLPETVIQRTADVSTTYYKFRFKNSQSALFSSFSDTIQGTGFASNSLGYIKQQALLDLAESISSELTHEMLTRWVQEGRRELDNDERVQRWSFRQKFNSIIGQITPGNWSMAAPTDLRNPNTSQNIYQIKVGLNKYPLIFQPKDIFNQNYLNMAHTTVKTSASAGATSLILNSSADFPIITTGTVTITISSQTTTGNTFNLTYTTNTLGTNTLSGIPVSGTGSIPAGGIAAGSDVWYNINFGLPAYYTVDNGTLYFDMPFMNSLGGQNIYMDYYQAMSVLTNDNSLLDEPQYDLFVSWLKWKIKYRKANGNLDKDTDPDFKEWSSRKNNIINNEIGDRDFRMFPG